MCDRLRSQHNGPFTGNGAALCYARIMPLAVPERALKIFTWRTGEPLRGCPDRDIKKSALRRSFLLLLALIQRVTPPA